MKNLRGRTAAKNRLVYRIACRIACLWAALAVPLAHAHSASDAYLTLSTSTQAAARGVLTAQWDVALRDLDFVLTLDDDGDGNITWAELRRHQAAITRYVLPKLVFRADGKACAVKPVRQLVDNHADGAYAALFFQIDCGAAAKRVALDYRLFFAVDPSHRAIVVMRNGNETATAVLSPDNAKIELNLQPPGATSAPRVSPR